MAKLSEKSKSMASGTVIDSCTYLHNSPHPIEHNGLIGDMYGGQDVKGCVARNKANYCISMLLLVFLHCPTRGGNQRASWMDRTTLVNF